MAFPTTPPPSTGEYTTAQGILAALIEGTAKMIVAGVSLGSVVVEAPGVNDKYDVMAGTILNGATNSLIAFTNVLTGYNIQIINKTANTVLKAKLGGTSKPEILVNNNSDEIGKSISGQKFTSIHLSNSSGSTISYEIIVTGV
jgi:hypothetical protein